MHFVPMLGQSCFATGLVIAVGAGKDTGCKLHRRSGSVKNNLLKLGRQADFTLDDVITEPGILHRKGGPQSLGLLLLLVCSFSNALYGIVNMIILAKLFIARAREVNRLSSNVPELSIVGGCNTLCSSRRETYLRQGVQETGDHTRLPNSEPCTKWKTSTREHRLQTIKGGLSCLDPSRGSEVFHSLVTENSA